MGTRRMTSFSECVRTNRGGIVCSMLDMHCLICRSTKYFITYLRIYACPAWHGEARQCRRCSQKDRRRQSKPARSSHLASSILSSAKCRATTPLSFHNRLESYLTRYQYPTLLTTDSTNANERVQDMLQRECDGVTAVKKAS